MLLRSYYPAPPGEYAAPAALIDIGYYHLALACGGVNEAALAKVYSHMVAFVGIVGIGIEEYKISAFELTDFFDFFSYIAVALVVGGAGQLIAEVRVDCSCKAGAIVGLGTGCAQNIFYSQIALAVMRQLFGRIAAIRRGGGYLYIVGLRAGNGVISEEDGEGFYAGDPGTFYAVGALELAYRHICKAAEAAAGGAFIVAERTEPLLECQHIAALLRAGYGARGNIVGRARYIALYCIERRFFHIALCTESRQTHKSPRAAVFNYSQMRAGCKLYQLESTGGGSQVKPCFRFKSGLAGKLLSAVQSEGFKGIEGDFIGAAGAVVCIRAGKAVGSVCGGNAVLAVYAAEKHTVKKIAGVSKAVFCRLLHFFHGRCG